MNNIQINQYSKSKIFFIKVAVLCIFLMKGVSVINVVLGNIQETFPDVSGTLISAISTVPVIFMFIMSLLSGKITQKYDKKNVLIVATVIYIVGGVGNYFFCSSIYQILFMRALLGIGAGLSAPLTGSIIADIFEGKERTKMMGYANAVGSIITSVLQYITGLLSVTNWRYAFLTYGIFIIILVIQIFALPSLKPSDGTAERGTKAAAPVSYTSSQRLRLFFVGAFCFVYLMLTMVYNMKLSMFVVGESIGDGSLVGSSMSISTFVAFGLGLVFASVTKFLGKYTLTVCCLISSVTFAIVLFANSPSMILIAGFVSGLQMGLVTPSLQMKALAICPGGNTTSAMSYVTCGLFLGQFCATFLEVIFAFFGDPSIRVLFTFGIFAFLVLAVLALLWTIFLPDNIPETNSATT